MPEAWAQIRYDYEHTDWPVEDICAEHGISSGTLRDRMRRCNWRRRRPPIPREGPPAFLVVEQRTAPSGTAVIVAKPSTPAPSEEEGGTAPPIAALQPAEGDAAPLAPAARGGHDRTAGHPAHAHAACGGACLSGRRGKDGTGARSADADLARAERHVEQAATAPVIATPCLRVLLMERSSR
jgi:hypothetical protein